MAAKLGILAGGGRLPGLLIEACRVSGREYFVLAFTGQADPDVIGDAPHEWVRMGAAGKGFATLHEQGVEELVLAGHVRRPTLADLRPDLTAIRFFAKLGIKGVGDDGLLRALIDELEDRGFKVVGADEVLPSLKAQPGPLGAHQPDGQAEADIARGVDEFVELATAQVLRFVSITENVDDAHGRGTPVLQRRHQVGSDEASAAGHNDHGSSRWVQGAICEQR